MKLSEWSKQQGITYRTAWQWFKEGKLPVPAIRTPSGSILVRERAFDPVKEAAIYARVSSHDQKSDLDRQVARLVQFAQEQGLVISQSVVEIGSGMNGRRSKLNQLLRDEKVKVIIVEHRDRLMRFGLEYLESSLAAHGRRLIVMDQGELKDDLVQDMVDVLTSFCARLYGKRSAKNKAKRALKELQKE
jgi:predicted site-specific integrase-resolvase